MDPSPNNNIIQINQKNFKLIAVNVNSMIKNQRRASLQNLIDSHVPHCVCISETKLAAWHKASFDGYNFFRTDRPSNRRVNIGGGGTAILLKENIKYRRIIPPVLHNPKVLEATVISIPLDNNDKLFLISPYASGDDAQTFIQELHCLFSQLKLHEPQNYYILAGDLNAKHTYWKNEMNNRRGNALINWIQNYEIEFKIKFKGPSSPTYPRTDSYLDICLADSRFIFNDLQPDRNLSTIPYDSDHDAILINLSLHKNFLFEELLPPDSFDYSHADWDKFQNLLSKTQIKIPTNRNLSKNEIDHFLAQIDQEISNAIHKSVPKRKKKSRLDDYMNEKIKKLQKTKSFLLTEIYKIYRSPKNQRDTQRLDLLQVVLDEVRRNLETEFNKSISDFWGKKIKYIPPHDSSKMFPRVNKIFRKKDPTTINSLLVPENNADILDKAGIDPTSRVKDANDNFIITDPVEKLDTIGAHFSKVNTQNSNLGNRNIERLVNLKVNELKNEIVNDEINRITVTTFDNLNSALNPTPIDDNKYFTNYPKLAKIFRKLSNKKSSGFDSIPHIALKHLHPKIIHLYTIIFNNALSHKYFPDQWKLAKVVAILKKSKDPFNPTSYRPIKLLPNISKVFEIIINKNITKFCKKHSLIPEERFGFRHKHSTVHAINNFTSDVCWALNNRESVGACLIDLEKAFDTVWLPGLFYLLINKKFPRHLIKIIWDMTHNKKFKVGNSILQSINTFSVDDGLQQGTVNSPLLFNIYTSNVLKIFHIYNELPKTKALAFADDLIIYITDKKVSTIKDKLQDHFCRVHNFFNIWKLKVNINKCETILFTPPYRIANNDVKKYFKSFKINEKIDKSGTDIPHKDCVKYLGINIDNKLTFIKHIDITLKKAKGAFHSNCNLFKNKHLHPKIKIICYQALIRPIITYGCPIWFNISNYQMERLRIFERKCLRTCLGLYKTPESNYTRDYRISVLYNEAKIPRIDNFMLKLTRDHISSSSSNRSNSLIFGLYYPNNQYFVKSLDTGNISPEAFTYLDANGYIQDKDNVPIIYHIKRGISKAIKYPPHSSHINNDDILYDTTLPLINMLDNYRDQLEKYWWLDDGEVDEGDD